MRNKPEGKLEVMKFDAVNIPRPTESKEKTDEKYITWGVNNLYPNHLVQLYSESAIHSSIINSKANYILGDGLKYEGGDNLRFKVNAADTFDEFISKLVTDYLIYNAFAVEVIYNVLNQPFQYFAIPLYQLRMNKSKTKFWVCDDWYNNNKSAVAYQRYRPNSPDSTSKIFYYDGYMPTTNLVYTQPEYFGSIPSIVLEAEIKKFNLNNIQNHFSVATLITFFNGIASEEVKNKALHDIKQSYTGPEGKKIILDFQPPNGQGAEVKNLSPGDWDKAYDLIQKAVKDDIMQGHQVTSPILFGVKTEGQLGGATELETAYEIFQNTYIRNKRNQLLSAFNVLFSDSELVKGRLEFAERQLFAERVPEAVKLSIYTINEFRAIQGLPALPDGDRMINEQPKPATDPVGQPKAFTGAETFSLSDEDFEKIKDMGIVADEFEFIQEGEFVRTKQDFNRIELEFENKTDIGEYIIKNKVSGQTIKELKQGIRKELGINVSIDELKGILADLNKAGVAKIDISDDGKVKVTAPDSKKTSKAIEVVYSYDVRAGYGAPIEDKTRPFCRKLIQNGRYYTREEIQTMASIFGYDIFTYGGGYYRNPDTGVLTSHCRHMFKAITVSRKTK